MRTLNLILKRNEKDDYVKDDIQYYGFSFLWEDDSPIQLNFASFCKTGIKTIFGNNFQNKDYKTTFYLNPVNEADPLTKIPNAKKVRRMYMTKSNNVITMFFSKGIPTDIKFTENDEEKTKNWIGFNEITESKYWFDFAATLEE